MKKKRGKEKQSRTEERKTFEEGVENAKTKTGGKRDRLNDGIRAANVNGKGEEVKHGTSFSV